MRTPTIRTSHLLRGAFVSGALALLSVAARSIPEGSAAELASGSESSRSVAPFAAELTFVAVRGFSITVPGTARGVVKLNMPAPVNKSGLGVTVSLQSGNPSVASVPATVYIPMSRDSGTFTVTGLSGGCTGITASYGGRTPLPADVVVHPSPTATTFSLTVPNQGLYRGVTSYYGTFNTDGRFSGTVYLSSSNPGVASVPASIPVKTGQTNARFTITTYGVGCAIITATVRGRTVTHTSRTVLVVPIPG